MPDSPSSTCRPSRPTRPATAAARETVIACDFTRKIVLIGGTSYAGEMKKSVFTYLNYVLPRAERHADALLRQCGHRRRRRRVLRPVGHRQDDALRRSRTASCSATTSMAGARTACSISRAAATPRPSACRARPSRRSSPPRERFGTVLENVVLDPITRVPDFDDASQDREHALRLSARLHPQCERHRPRRHPEEHRDAHLRCLRRAAADRQADAGARPCITSSPATPRRWPARRRA